MRSPNERPPPGDYSARSPAVGSSGESDGGSLEAVFRRRDGGEKRGSSATFVVLSFGRGTPTPQAIHQRRKSFLPFGVADMTVFGISIPCLNRNTLNRKGFSVAIFLVPSLLYYGLWSNTYNQTVVKSNRISR
jgi:hypothetical protein